MDSTVRRIVAVAAHAKRIGRCPTTIHSLGTGETAEIRPTAKGFIDLPSGLEVCLVRSGLSVAGLANPIDLDLDDDVGFVGFDPESGRFSGRCGGGASVTIYDGSSSDFFQYAVVTETRSRT